MGTPSAEYSNRLDACLKTIARKQKLHLRAGNIKLALIAACLVMAWFAIYPRDFSLLWLLLPAGIYVVLAVFHHKINRARSRGERIAAFYRRGLARIEDRWANGGQTGERFRSIKSIYAEDLDLFGPASLFELLSTARTTMGEARLAHWLAEPSSIPEIRERQAMVAELRDKLNLREDLAVAGEELRADFDAEALTRWAMGEAAGWSPALRWLFPVLVACTAASAVLLAATKIILPFLILFACEIALTIWRLKTAKVALHGLEATDLSLLLLASILERVEAEAAVAPHLRKLAAELNGQRTPASRATKRLARVVSWLNARDSLFIRIFDLPLMYTMQLGFAAEEWRRKYGHCLSSWLDVIGEIEAVISLATYSWEHPDDPFPRLIESEAPVFDGENLGHPLIPSAACVRNSVRLARNNTQVLMVSGSNMSGKSTLLRVVGVNTVLAMAGAAVRAKSLDLTPLALGTSIRTTDSLQEGRSGFYTEILRLREILGLAERHIPVLFLLDELLAGTNSTDRRAGAEGVIRELIARGALGMVTTHDLALTAISAAPSRPDAIANAHFEERIADGQMKFDYKLREGVVERGNALELMRMIGLKIQTRN